MNIFLLSCSEDPIKGYRLSIITANNLYVHHLSLGFKNKFPPSICRQSIDVTNRGKIFPFFEQIRDGMSIMVNHIYNLPDFINSIKLFLNTWLLLI